MSNSCDKTTDETIVNLDEVNLGELKQKLNQDTGKINWRMLDRQHQLEAVIEVDPSLDLVSVASAFVLDNHAQVASWMSESKIGKLNNEKANVWKVEDKEIWAVVVAPWVLVQELK